MPVRVLFIQFSIKICGVAVFCRYHLGVGGEGDDNEAKYRGELNLGRGSRA